MPSPVRPASVCGEGPERLHDAAAAAPDVVAVHDPDEDAVGVGVEPLEQLGALVVEVGA